MPKAATKRRLPAAVAGPCAESADAAAGSAMAGVHASLANDLAALSSVRDNVDTPAAEMAIGLLMACQGT